MAGTMANDGNKLFFLCALINSDKFFSDAFQQKRLEISKVYLFNFEQEFMKCYYVLHSEL